MIIKFFIIPLMLVALFFGWVFAEGEEENGDPESSIETTENWDPLEESWWDDGDEVSSWGITSTEFMINPRTFSPGGNSLWTGWTQRNVDNLLTRVLNVLIVVFWVMSVFVMTIGAGYMIIYHGQDEMLSKGKSIFVSGIIALVIALSAWLIVRLFIYLLYN